MELIGEEWPFKCFIETVEDISLKIVCTNEFLRELIIKELSKLILKKNFFIIKKINILKYFLQYPVYLFFFFPKDGFLKFYRQIIFFTKKYKIR